MSCEVLKQVQHDGRDVVWHKGNIGTRLLSAYLACEVLKQA